MCRLGTNQMTRKGLVEKDMATVANLVILAADGEEVKDQVHALVKDLELEFTLD